MLKSLFVLIIFFAINKFTYNKIVMYLEHYLSNKNQNEINKIKTNDEKA